jgi:hypothetical protein
VEVRHRGPSPEGYSGGKGRGRLGDEVGADWREAGRGGNGVIGDGVWSGGVFLRRMAVYGYNWDMRLEGVRVETNPA